MTKHQDDRIEPEYVEQMKQFASLVDKYFNPDGRKLNCFVLLVTPFGSEPGRVNYLSNGERGDIVTMMKEVVARFEGQPETKGEA